MNKLLLVLVGVGLIGGAIGLYLYNKPHQEILNSKPDFIYTAASIIDEFDNISEKEEAGFIDKVFEISGKVNKIDSKDSAGLVLFFGDDLNIRCEIDPNFIKSAELLQTGDEVIIKGLMSGIEGNENDSIFSNFNFTKTISLSRCVLVE